MIEVRQVHTQAEDTGCQRNSCSLCKPHELFLPDGFHEPRDDQEEDDKRIVIRHLHVVGINLEGGKDSRYHKAPQVFPAIGQYDTRNQRWQIGQRPYLPDMSGSDDNQEIGAESPDDGTQRSQMLTKIEGTQQNVET